MTLTLEKKIEIVNAINTAVAKGHTVKTGGSMMTYGASMHQGSMVYVDRLLENPLHFSMRAIRQDHRIVIESETEVIYEPPHTQNDEGAFGKYPYNQ